MQKRDQKSDYSETPKSDISLKITILGFWKVAGPNCGSKFTFSKKEPTRLLGVVIIRLGARAMKKTVSRIGEIWTTPIGGPLTGAF